ncbi:MAG TPA: universal stress protein [Rhodospirillales bacterium]|jgi:nucleotide-binding universal stress UspA family protein
MTIRTMVVPVDGSEAATPVMAAALQFARDLGAHVEVLQVRADPKDTIPLLGEGMSVAMIEDMIQIAEKEGRERASRGRHAFDDLVRKFGLANSDKPQAAGASATWREEIGRDDEVTARRGRLADLMVVGRPTAASDVSSTLTLNAAVFDTGRPVLVVPPGGATVSGKNVAISWNGSAESSRAVAYALPLLKRADKVTVFTAPTAKIPLVHPQDLASYLQWHDIKPTARTLDVGTTDRQAIAVALLAALTEGNADLLVMGAYTHSRMRQLILGGFTRHVLENAKLPLFMAH